MGYYIVRLYFFRMVYEELIQAHSKAHAVRMASAQYAGAYLRHQVTQYFP